MIRREMVLPVAVPDALDRAGEDRDHQRRGRERRARTSATFAATRRDRAADAGRRSSASGASASLERRPASLRLRSASPASVMCSLRASHRRTGRRSRKYAPAPISSVDQPVEPDCSTVGAGAGASTQRARPSAPPLCTSVAGLAAGARRRRSPTAVDVGARARYRCSVELDALNESPPIDPPRRPPAAALRLGRAVRHRPDRLHRRQVRRVRPGIGALDTWRSGPSQFDCTSWSAAASAFVTSGAGSRPSPDRLRRVLAGRGQVADDRRQGLGLLHREPVRRRVEVVDPHERVRAGHLVREREERRLAAGRRPRRRSSRVSARPSHRSRSAPR